MADSLLAAFTDLVTTPEADLVGAIFADRLLADTVGVPPSIHSPFTYRLAVAPCDLGLPPESFGDVDALLVEAGHPELASVVEFKRVKVTSATLSTRRPNKLPELRKAVHQANRLRQVGFCHVWVTVIVVADIRSITAGTAFGFVPSDLVEQVRDAISLPDLNPGIGVTICEISQTAEQPANLRGTSGGVLLKSADTRPQPPALTHGIERFFDTPLT